MLFRKLIEDWKESGRANAAKALDNAGFMLGARAILSLPLCENSKNHSDQQHINDLLRYVQVYRATRRKCHIFGVDPKFIEEIDEGVAYASQKLNYMPIRK